MGELPLSLVDMAVLAVLGLSALLAFFRGFVKEVLSIVGWVAAAFATIYGFPYVQPHARDLVAYRELADLGAGVVLFVVTLLVFGLIGHAIASQVKESAVSGLDRALGFLFGAARGAVIVSLAYIGAQWAWGPDKLPGWIAQARTEPAMAQGADMLLALTPADMRERAGLAADEAESAAESLRQIEELQRNLMAPRPGEPTGTVPPADEGAYDEGARGNLDRLIEREQQ